MKNTNNEDLVNNQETISVAETQEPDLEREIL
jgi:hypothetical protein